MAYLTQAQLKEIGFKSIGKNVKISDKASIYDAEKIEIGDHSRIDDFCVISGKIKIGSYCHITAFCLIGGGEQGVFFEDYVSIAYGVKVYSQTDDYSGENMVSSLIPKDYTHETKLPVILSRHVIVGANTVILPGVTVAEGCSVGAMSLIRKDTQPWGIYAGVPAKRIKERSRNLLTVEKAFLAGIRHDSF